MVDITTVQPFNVPPEIEALQNDNIQLSKNYEALKESSKLTRGVLITVVAVTIISMVYGTYKKIEDDNNI